MCVLNRTKVIVAQLFQWIAALVLAVVVTSCFTYFYFYIGDKRLNPTGVTKYTAQPNHVSNSMTEGICFGRSDDNGFNNLKSNLPKIDILLMGASHMGAGCCPQDKITGALLNEYMPELNTYNISMSGNIFSRCLSVLSRAIEVYRPRKYVVIHTAQLDLTDVELSQIARGEIDNVKNFYLSENRLQHYLYEIPTAYYVAKQIKDKYTRETMPPPRII